MYARAYILLLFGGVLFPDTNDNCVHMNCLLLLEDLDRCNRLSWGSAVLACLYRNLCKASLFVVNTIAGPLMLLQLWAWCRIPVTEPRFVGQRNDMPYGVRYILYFV